MTSLADIDLVLASTSRYRRDLLSRLTTNFRTIAPQVDESARPGEAPGALAARLALAKARAVADACDNALVIGSDQVAELQGIALGKPGTPEAARQQLAASSGRRVTFHTALCLINTRDAGQRARSATDITRALFRDLGTAEIARYVAIENPLDCAGSFKAESLGISLFERIESDDPTALIGLPLIALSRLLREAGIALP
jgi:septum formation protein